MSFKPKCGLCKNTGRIVATHKTLQNLYGFRCECENGNNYSKRIPVWSSKYFETFTNEISNPVPVERKKQFVHEPRDENEWSDEVPF